MKSVWQAVQNWFATESPPPVVREAFIDAIIEIDDGKEYHIRITGETVYLGAHRIMTAEDNLALKLARYRQYIAQNGVVLDGVQYLPHRIKRVTWL